MLFPELKRYVGELVTEFDQISDARRGALHAIAVRLQGRLASGEEARLTFICTHNSRRSLMARIWAQTAAAYFGVRRVCTYSGGTEATAFNPRAVAALERAGFRITKTTESANPIYRIRFQARGRSMTDFSKVYCDDPNPRESFDAVLTCAHADRACPVVLGAGARFALPYEDPKAADRTPAEAGIYDQRARQIGRDMFFLMSLIQKK